MVRALRRHVVLGSLLAPAVIVALTLAGCGSSSSSGAAAGSGDNAAVRTDVGVTATSISLGIMTDLSGPFLTFGRSTTQAGQLFIKQLNAQGGVCGRKITLQVRDHAYDVSKALTQYRELEPNVLGLEQLLGSSITNAMLENITNDHVLTAPASWSSTLLKNPYVAVMGTTYDVETVNAVDYLVRQRGVKAGDTIVHVYDEGDYGGNAVLGSRYAATNLRLTLREVKVAPTDIDDLADVALAAKQAGAKAIVLSTSVLQTQAMLMDLAKAGLNLPIIVNSPGFAPSLLQTAGPALTSSLLVVGSSSPVSNSLPEVKKVLTQYKAEYPNQPPDLYVTYGYAAAKAYTEILRRACAAKDLTRNGVTRVFRSTDKVSMDGLMTDLDFSHPGSPPARASYISQADHAAEGGLTVVQQLFAAPLALSYRAPVEP